MEKVELNQLFEAIKKDDLKSFSSLMLSKSDLNICFGRFPILSLLYLYGSYKILDKFEKWLLPIHNYNVVEENYDAYLKFKRYAKKSLKIFVLNERIIYPIEMLAILDERYLLNKYFKKLYKNEEIVENLRKIYILNQKIEIDVSIDNIELPKKKLIARQKWFVAIMVSIFAFVIAVSSISVVFIKSTSGIGTMASPIKITSASGLQSAIKKGKRYYSLEKDIVLTETFVPYDFSGTIFGNGHKISAGEFMSDGFVKKLTGNIEHLAISAKIKNKNISQNYAIIAEKSSGNIKKCEIFAEIDLKTYNDEDVYLAGMVADNSGVIEDSVAMVNGTISNNRSSNVFFAGIAGLNTGTVKNSKTNNSKLEADTVDLGGIVAENKGVIENCENNLSLIQTSAKEWNPNTAGVSITNYGTIKNCKNFALVSAESTMAEKNEEYEFATIVGGVVCDNYGSVSNSINKGKVACRGDVTICYVGGVVARNIFTEEKTAVVEKSKCQLSVVSDTMVEVYSKSNLICVGGVVGHNSSEIVGCGFVGTINATTDIETNGFAAYVGGVVGYNNSAKLESSYSNVEYVGISELSTLGLNHLYGLVAGCLGVVQYAPAGLATAHGLTYVKDNHYVVVANKCGVAYGVSSVLSPIPVYNQSTGRYEYQIISQSPVEIKSEEIFVAHEKLEDIASEVILNG